MHRTALVLLSVLFAAALQFARADATFKTLSRVTIPGGLGTVESRTSMEYQGDRRARIDSSRIAGGLACAFAGGLRTVFEVTRLDMNLVWSIDHAGKTYTERMIGFPTETEVSGFGTREQKPASASGPRFRVVKSELKVEKTGKSKTVNGFPCEEFLFTWDVVLEDTAAKTKVEQLMTIDRWNTPLTETLRQASTIEGEFNQKLYKKLGVDMTAEDMKRMGIPMLSQVYGVDSREAAGKMEQVGRELAKVEGYPIVTEVKWQLKPDSGAAAAKDTQPRGAEPAVRASPGGLTALADDEPGKEQPEPEAEVLFTSYVEVKSVSLADIPFTDFELLRGYKKVVR